MLLARREGLLRRRPAPAQGRFPERPAFSHPDFDFETRVVIARLPELDVASVYVPNGGKDFPAKMRFLEAMDEHARQAQASGRAIVLAGDLNVARTEMDVHPKERKPRAIGQLPEERELLERIISRGLVDLGRALDPDNEQLFTWWPPWRSMRAAQHRLAPRLHSGEHTARRQGHALSGVSRGGHQRPRAGARRVRRRLIS